MENIAIVKAGPAAEFSQDYISKFIDYIDRSEKTIKTYIGNLRQFAAWLNYESIKQPTRKDIIEYKDYLGAEHEAIIFNPKSPNKWSYRTDKAGHYVKVKCKPNTVKQYLQSVCQFFKWTASEGLYPNIADNIHAPKVRHDAHKKEALSAADVLRVENSIIERASNREAAAAASKKDAKGKAARATEQDKRLFAMYLLAVNCGLRTVEISRANIGDIETIGGVSYIYIWGKGHAEADQKKPLAPQVKEAIDDYLQSRKDAKTMNSPLFVSTGNRSGGKRIATTTISTMLKRALQEAGFNSERITAHSLRHTTGTNIQEITGNLYITQKYMRHANPATTEIYLHNDTERQEAEIAQRLYNRYHNKTDATEQSLETILAKLNNEQLKQLASIAAAMTH